MKWFIFAIVAAAILLVFAAVYALSAWRNKLKRPKYKTTAPDDDPKFLRDLAEKLKAEPDSTEETDGPAEGPASDK